eukprot:XP_001699028.1 predicted protein [Chlamydomonas reinhardtii]
MPGMTAGVVFRSGEAARHKESSMRGRTYAVQGKQEWAIPICKGKLAFVQRSGYRTC